MIYGIGHDVLEIERISAYLNRGTGVKFLQRILTEREARLAAQKGNRIAEFVAGRFAAKEAVVKALGCGIGATVGFQDIEIWPDALGKPEVALSGGAWERLGLAQQEYNVLLTITHSRGLASAFAVVERIGRI
ncbi:holo-ACP synthase [Paenibacillus albidus]|uniref:holo-ACP synthase n=1 Tax=Paenibacillus albidus TaxID=2041023 RepID=UPI001BE7FB0D|nr:holo-ACP synthase [Paenibacillus albidus]MBT2291789.1 holo-ACP synthase [Paenibacillus albidus]